MNSKHCFTLMLRNRFAGAIVVAAYLAISGHSTQAATNTFSAGTSWNTPADWSLGATPVAGQALLFSTLFPATTTLDASFTADTLSFNNAGTMAIDANASVATAQTLTLNNTTTNANGTSDVISLLGGGTVNMGVTASKGTLTLALVAATNNINVADGGSLVFGANSVISGAAKALSFTGNSTGKLTMTGNNSFTGGFTLTSGTVKAVTNNNALGVGALNLNGGTLDIMATTTFRAYNTTVGGNMTILSDLNSSGAGILYSLGSLTIGANTLTIGKGSNITSGNARVAFNGALTLTGNATFDSTGSTSNVLNNDTTGSNTAIKLTGNFNMTFKSSDGTGLTSLRGPNASTRSSGVTTLESGILQLNSSSTTNASGLILGTTATTLQLNGGTLDLAVDKGIAAYNTTVGGSVAIISDKGTGSTAGINQTLGTLSIGAYTLSVTSSSNVNSGVAGLQFGATTLTGNATFSVANGTNTGGSTTTLTLSGIVSDGGNGYSLTKTGATTMALSGANTYSGNTLVSTGTLALSNNLALQNSAINTSGTGVITLSVTTPTFGGLVDGTGQHALATVITTGYSSVTAITLNPGTGITDSYSGVIANGAAGMTLTKSGSGTQVLSGLNTYSGITTVSAGVLVAGANAPSGSAGVFGNASSAINMGDANSALNAISLLANGAFTVARPITVNNNGGTITIGGSLTSGTAIYSGNITLNKGVTLTASAGGTVDFKTGTWSTGNNALVIGSGGNTGTVILDNALDTTGGITVSFGTFMLNSAFTGGAMTVSSVATLSGSGSVGLTTGVTGGMINGNGLTLTGAVTFNGASNTLSGNETATAGVTVAAGASLTQSGTLAGNISLANGASTSLTGGGTVGTVSMNGGGDTINGNPTLTTSGITVNGANNTIGSGTITGNASQAASSGLTVNGNLNGTDTLGLNATLSGTGTVGATSLSGTDDLSSTGTLTVASLAVSGGGNTISSGTVNATAGTTVTGTTGNNGSLKVNGTLNGGVTGSATGSGSAAIGGSGTINGGITVNAGGVLAPGDATITTSGGSVAINNGGGAAFAIANTRLASGSNTVTAGTDYDQVKLTAGNLTFSGSTSLTLNIASGAAATIATYAAGGGGNPVYIGVSDSTPGVNTNTALDNYFVFRLSGGTTSGHLTTLTLVDSTGDTLTGTILYGTGRFSDTNIGDIVIAVNVNGSATFDGSNMYSQEFALSYTGNYLTNSTTGGNDLVLTAIPEPSTWGMILGGFGMLISFQRLRKRRLESES